MEWPVPLPDLNQIEYVWQIMKDCVEKKISLTISQIGKLRSWKHG
jgi:transposase